MELCRDEQRKPPAIKHFLSDLFASKYNCGPQRRSLDIEH